MLYIACANVWNYLIRKRMWKSFPMTMAYLILIYYSLLCIIYEILMSWSCGEHDCLTTVLALDKTIQ